MLNREICKRCWDDENHGKKWENPRTPHDINRYFETMQMICPWMQNELAGVHIHTYGPIPKQCPFITEQSVSQEKQPC